MLKLLNNIVELLLLLGDAFLELLDFHVILRLLLCGD